MPSDDTVKLLKECDAGIKTAVTSIREVVDNVKSEQLLTILTESLTEHEKLGNEAHELLNESGDSGKDPNPMAKAMSWMKINMKLLDKNTDSTVAGLILDGCSMGIKQVSGYINQYKNADSEAVTLAENLVKEEEKLMKEMKEYL